MEKTFAEVPDKTQFHWVGRTFKKTIRADKPYNAICVVSPDSEETPSAWTFDNEDVVKEAV